jgi:2-dehydro-3-deoxygluconokinase
MSGILTMGESLGLLRAHGIGTLEHLASMDVAIGGAEGNVAIGLARLGTPATWVGVVGDDGLGQRVVRELRGQGVRVIARVNPTAPTAVMLKENPTAGLTRVTYFRSAGAGRTLEPSDVEALERDGELAGIQLVHVTGITPALSESAASATRALVDAAHRHGIPVSFDVNHRSRLWTDRDPVPVYRELVASSDIVFAGEDEAALVVGGNDGAAAFSDDELIAGLVALGPREVVLKRGAAGATAREGDETLSVAAVPVSVVDSVGAGDAFVAGYLAEWVAGETLAARLQTAVRAGAFACTGSGDWESAPRRRDLEMLGASGDPVIR